MKIFSWLVVLVVVVVVFLLTGQDNGQATFKPTAEVIVTPLQMDDKDVRAEAISTDQVDAFHPQDISGSLIEKAIDEDAETEVQIDKSCVPVEERLTTNELSVVQFWELEQGLAVEHLADIYGLQTEQELFDAAELGDADAMLALGLNYLHNSRHVKFRSPLLYNKEDRQNSHERTALDKEILQRGYDWLWQAAVNGKLIAFHYLGESMEDEQRRQKTQDDTLLTAKTKAHNLMIKSLLPPGMMRDETRERYDEMLNEPEIQQQLTELKANWAAEREKQGLEPITQIPVPEKVQQHIKTILLECDSPPQ